MPELEYLQVLEKKIENWIAKVRVAINKGIQVSELQKYYKKL